MLAMANAELETPLKSPANASVSTVLEELNEKDAFIDMLRLMSVALPPREGIWWACLAARDMIGPDVEKVPLPLERAEAWVRKPNDETRNAAHDILDVAAPDDDTEFCASAVAFCDGKLGTGDLSEHDAPPGACAMSVFAMNVIALEAMGDDLPRSVHFLVDRAINIARGGNGQIDPIPTEEKD
jgi:hypothetical protein